MEKTAKIYVAGHRGLVGSAILNNLEKKGYKNIVVRTHADLDLKDTAAVSAFFNEEKPEYVFLAAAKVGGIVANNTYRADFIYENLMIQNNVIHQSYVNKVKKLLFLGSTCIYPKNCPQPMKEDYLLTDVLEYTNEPYAIAKIAGIKMCESYNLQYGTNFMSVMPTNLYGPNDNFDLENSHVLPAIIRKIYLAKLLADGRKDEVVANLKTDTFDEAKIILNRFNISAEKVELWGSGKPMREFLWSEDMADACVFIMENRNFADCYIDHEEIRNTHINIGTGKDISIKDLAYTVKNIIGYNGKLLFNTDMPDGTMRKLTDCSKLNVLGWKYTTELDQGIRTLYNWMLKA
ncbi:GDP-L-fucose synthase [Flavobacterium sp. J372]|uniref:GDP-L-fucose synthase family protein n=1 Tax=Flavobacterium sp. J372 TaxID=2898436 RepID=UPI00215143E9|nr:GDP-L-fucose synthase [Flavobacterium sp. J372]MCR5861174.1 GDP-L-fucose synthase [Flavobacterium sp. J372]